MVDPMAKLSRWLRYSSRRAQPSGHRKGEETQADRVPGVVVVEHNGGAADLSGDMEGPSVHQVHEGWRGCTVQCDADHGASHRTRGTHSPAWPGCRRPPVLTPMPHGGEHPGDAMQAAACCCRKRCAAAASCFEVSLHLGATVRIDVGRLSLVASDGPKRVAHTPRQTIEWALLSSRSPAGTVCRRPPVLTPMPFAGEHPGEAMQAAACCCM